MPGAVTQTVAGGADFDGLTNATGLFTFTELDNAPPNSRVIARLISVHVEPDGGGGDPIDTLQIMLLAPGSTPAAGNRTLLANLTLADMQDGDRADAFVAGCSIPRVKGSLENWSIAVVSTAKLGEGFATVDWQIETIPDDSRAPA